ncbi:glioma pathogenesis-related protein 1-like [Glandiceps talaboti]
MANQAEDTVRLLQTLFFISLLIPSMVSTKESPSIAKSNKSFFNLKPFTKEEKVGHHRTKRSTDFSSSDIDTMLERHNYHRSNVNPGASDMKYMQWDDDLASMAQDWSDGCLWAHGNPTNISPYSNVGQNLWMVGGVSSSYSVNPEGPVDAWYNEVNYYTYDDNSCTNVCGHYTQVVWADSYAVGCGKTYCSSVSSSSFTNAIIVTCNYGPAGNYAGTKPYSLGSPCTQCSSGIGQCYENQCTFIFNGIITLRFYILFKDCVQNIAKPVYATRFVKTVEPRRVTVRVLVKMDGTAVIVQLLVKIHIVIAVLTQAGTIRQLVVWEATCLQTVL